MREMATNRDGKCLSKVYINGDHKLKWQCSKGHQWETRPVSIRSGSWCPHCAKVAPLSIDIMRVLAAKHGGQCLSEKYINAYSKLKWQCAKGHQWKTKPELIRSGSWCPVCAVEKRRGMREGRLNN